MCGIARTAIYICNKSNGVDVTNGTSLLKIKRNHSKLLYFNKKV